MNHIPRPGGPPRTAIASAAGTINIWRRDDGSGYRVVSTFTGGGEAWARTMRGAVRLAMSMSRWWRRHQGAYLARLACVQDPGNRMPRGWTRPRRCRGGRCTTPRLGRWTAPPA